MKWILCDERLPKEGQMVLTTIRGHDVITLQEGETLEEAMERIWNDVCYVSIGFIGSDGWYGADGFPEVVHPIAWMPLPKPYRKTENSSEKPNNCDTCRNKGFEGCEQPCLGCGCCGLYEPKTEPQTYVINPQEPTNDDKCFECDDFFTCDGQCDEVEDEPQTCSVNGRPYDCGNCEYFRCTADEPQTERSGE